MKPVVAFVLAAAVAASVAACGGGAPSTETRKSPPAAVRTERVASIDTAHQTRAVGVLAPRDEIRLSFKVGGVVERVLVESGDIVRKGQLLAELKRAEVDAAVAQATEAVDKARRDLERAKRLRADEVATEEQVENLTTAYTVARANAETAHFNARFARIEAPSDGIVFERTVEGGELVQAGQPVVVLGSTTSGWVVRIGLSDRDIVRVDAGTTAQVQFDAFPGRAFEGRVTRIGAASDRMTGTFEVEVEVQPEGARFARGLVAKVSLPLAQMAEVSTTATVVPVTALVEANGLHATVYVLDATGNVARRKDVTIGPILGEQVVIAEGLTVGESIITDGAAWLTDGRAVRVIADQG